MKILYIVDLDKKIKIVKSEKEEIVIKSIKTYLNELCLENLCTMKGRIDAVKKKFCYKYNVPLFINKENIFMKVIGRYPAWINVVEIDKIYKESDKVVLTFLTGKVLKINIGYRTFMKNFQKTDELYKYVKKNK